MVYLPDSNRYFLSASANPLLDPDNVTLLEFLSVKEGVIEGPNTGQ
jgi:hypothetical protein